METVAVERIAISNKFFERQRILMGRVGTVLLSPERGPTARRGGFFHGLRGMRAWLGAARDPAELQRRLREARL